MNTLDPFGVPLSGTQLIEASAGTGKTHTITTLFLRLLIEGRCRIEQILVVTFTNAATAELRERIRDRLRCALDVFDGRARQTDPELAAFARESPDRAAARDRIARALAHVDQTAIFTIHGFCQRVLSEYAFESATRFDAELVTDDRPLVAEIAQDYSTKERCGAPLAVVCYLRQCNVTLESLVSLTRLAVAWPDIPFEPRFTYPEIAPRLDAYLSARAAVARAWPASRPRVLEVLRSLGSPYTKARVERWAAQLDALCSVEMETRDGWFDEFRYFTGTEIRASSRGKTAKIDDPFFLLCDDLAAASSELGDHLERWMLAYESGLIEYARAEFPERKRKRGLVTFDDLLHELRRTLRGQNGAALRAELTRRFPAALIDEFHDTDSVQYDIFRSIYDDPDTLLFFIGDPKQAIYSFRGADVFAYLAAVHDSTARWTLTVNRRSDPSMVRAVNTLFSRVTAPFVFQDIAFTPVKTPDAARDRLRFGDAKSAAALEILFVRGHKDAAGRDKAPERDDVAALVADDVARLLARGATIDGRPVEPEDIAVLTRSNKQARDIQAALHERGIVSALQGDSSVFESDEATELGYVLRALAEPSKPSAVKSALATTLFGLDANELFSLRDDEAWERWTADFHRWHDIWEARGFVESIRRLMHETNATSRMLGAPGGERRLTNFLHLIELLQKEAIERRLKIVGLVQWFDDVRHNTKVRDGALAPEAQQIRLESDEKAVHLTTMHRSKGLEYPIVYCPYLFDGTYFKKTDERYLRYHDPDDDYTLKLDLRPRERKERAFAAAERELLAENLRLSYVALTRAKHHTIVVWGGFRNSEKSSLGYLLHPPESEAFETAAEVRIGTMGEDALMRDLSRLVDASGGTIRVRVADTGPAPHYVSPPGAAAGDLKARMVQRRLTAVHRISSYSGLVSTSPSREARALRDVDDSIETPEAVPVESASAERLVRLHDFPRGTGPGELIHTALENIDFLAGRDAWRKVVIRECRRYGVDAHVWGEVLLDGLADATGARLGIGDRDFRLSDVPLQARLNEMEFSLPVRRGRHGSLTAARVAEVMTGAGNGVMPPGYIDRVARLQFAPLVGFLRGYIDLVFEHDGRYYLVDYKSNFLGSMPRDYEQERLREAMAVHHYFLQYYVYTVALDRYLARRLPNYDFERHFGGVFYLFIRGMSVEAPGRGVFFDRPTPAVARDLDALFGETPGEEVRP